MATPNVFVIESLEFRDERKRCEGRLLTGMLALAGRKSEYRYIRTKKELEKVLGQFRRSKMRYLHLSCHGTKKKFLFTLDKIPVEEFCRLARPVLRHRRLFISACDVANRRLAKHLFAHSGCQSLVGPVGKITFTDSATFLSAFYHLVFKENPQAMKRGAIKRTLQRLCDAFGISMRYFTSRPHPPFFAEIFFEPNRPPRYIP